MECYVEIFKALSLPYGLEERTETYAGTSAEVVAWVWWVVTKLGESIDVILSENYRGRFFIDPKESRGI